MLTFCNSYVLRLLRCVQLRLVTVTLSDVYLPTALQYNTENSKQIFPEKKLRRLRPDFHIHVSVSDLYIPTIGLPILLQENMLTDPVNI